MREYESLDPLQVRIQAHLRHSLEPDDPEQAVIDALRGQFGRALLDVGCGTGTFLARVRRAAPEVRLVALDTSPAAGEAVSPEIASFVLASVLQLPFEEQFDVVTARHMLYHVDDPARAISEMTRAATPQGRVLVTVNHGDGLPWITETISDAMHAEGLTPRSSAASVDSAAIHELMQVALRDVQSRRIDNALVFRSAGAVLPFLGAVLGVYGLHTGDTARPAVEARLADAVSRRLSKDREIVDPKGYTVCWGRKGD